MKRIIRYGLIVLATIFMVSAALIWWNAGSVTRWIGGQIQLIAGWYLNPKLTFSDLTYESPLTVRLKNFRLTAADPTDSSKSIDILGADQVTIQLAEIPKIGQPIKIQKIILDKPLFQAIAVGLNSSQFIGFSDLIKSSGRQNQESAPSGAKLSEVFQMNLLQLNDGRIVYNPRIPGTPPMELDHINTQLDIQSTTPGWYSFSTAIARQPVFDLSVAGKLNIDTFDTDDLNITLKAQLDPRQNTELPPQLQQVLAQHDVHGLLDIKLTGSAPLMNPANGKAALQVSLNQANISFSDYQVPIDQMTLVAQLADGKVQIQKLNISALRGEADMTGAATLNDRLDADLNLKITNMILQDTLRQSSAGQQAKYSGRLNASLQAAAPLRVAMAKAYPGTPPSDLAAVTLPAKWGSGQITVDHAKLVNLPLVQQLTQIVGKVTSALSIANQTAALNDSAQLGFTLGGDSIQLSDINMVTDVIAVRGTGTVTLDQKLDLLLHGGPVEKVESLLGNRIGGALGQITDNVVAYHVTGTLSNPIVTPQVGGQSLQDAGNGAGKIGQGIGGVLNNLDKAIKGSGDK